LPRSAWCRWTRWPSATPVPVPRLMNCSPNDVEPSGRSGRLALLPPIERELTVTTPTIEKLISYNIKTDEYDCTLVIDDVYHFVGTAPTYGQAEVCCARAY